LLGQTEEKMFVVKFSSSLKMRVDVNLMIAVRRSALIHIRYIFLLNENIKLKIICYKASA